MKIWKYNKALMAMLAVFGMSVVTVGYANSTQVASATNAPPASIIAPSQVNLPLVPAKVLQMSEAGVSDELIAAYIQKSAHGYALNAQQIIYLHDLGISSAVLKTLVENEGTAASAPAEEASTGTSDVQNDSSATATTDSAPPVTGAAVYFYDALAPYGTWVNLPAYGWCWQPAVVIVNPAWQPYSNNGCWLWTDQGWYWNSYYSWGWAPFHYGRWCQYPGYGWMWCPDDVWGPAWVCWRDYPGYCGWAPLPPGACFTAGVGWTFNGVSVGFDYGFGLGYRSFTFCDYDDFCRKHPFDHFRHGRDADRFFEHSRVDNDFALDMHHRFINRGIAPSRIEAVTHSRIGQVPLREFQHGTGHFVNFTMPDRLTRNGNNLVIYRPDPNLSVMRNHFQHGVPSPTHWRSPSAVHGLAAERTFSNPRALQVVRPSNRRTTAPNATLNAPGLNAFNHNQRRANVETPQAMHFPPAQSYLRSFPESRRSTPAWHPAPSMHPTPVWNPAETTRAAPAWHPVTPAVHPTRVFHPASVFHATPTFHPAPAFQPAPAFSHPARASGSVHFGGGGAHFGGRRRR